MNKIHPFKLSFLHFYKVGKKGGNGGNDVVGKVKTIQGKSLSRRRNQEQNPSIRKRERERGRMENSGQWLEKTLIELCKGMETGLDLDEDIISGLVSYCELASPLDAQEYLHVRISSL